MKKKKIISLCMAAIMAVSTVPMTAFAASSVGSTSTDTTVGEDTAQGAKTQYSEMGISDTQTQVYLTVEDKDLIASLPTTIIVSGTPTTEGKYVGEYSVGVSGDMSGDKVVTIEPESANVALKQKGNNDKMASISQQQTVFNSDDFKNKTRTNGAVTADSLTAGSWNGKFNFNIRCQQVQYNYYSSIELAANDANNMTTANADVSKDDINKAVAALVISNNKATIKMLNDESNVDNITLTQDTSINLNTHTVTFAEGKYLTFEKNLTINDGILNGINTHYVVLGATTNTNNTLSINNVTINQEVGATVSTSSFAIDVSVINTYSNNLTINQTGDGNSSNNVVGLSTRNADLSAISSHNNLTITENIKNPKKITGIQAGNITIDGSEINIATEKGYCYGIRAGAKLDGSVCNVSNANININSKQNNTNINYGLVIYGGNTLIQGCNVYSDNTKNVAVGIEIYTAQNTANTVIKDTDVYGKQWGVQTGSFGKTTIKKCDISSTNHTAYICGSADIYNSTFKTEGRENYQSSDLDKCYGIYCGNPEKSRDNIVNIYNSTIGNPIDTSGVNVPQSALTAKYNGYIAPKEINVYNSTLYQGSSSIFSFNVSSPYVKNYTKFNLYNNTKLMSNSTTELDTEKVTNDIIWFNNPEINYSLNPDWETAKDDYIYFGSMCSPNKLILAQMYCKNNDPKSVAYEDYANVYDYR